MNTGSSVQVGLAGPAVWIRVTGRGSFQNSGGLKDVATAMTGRGFGEFIVDLKDCELMDSTFMGTLAGIAMKLRPQGTLRIVQANPRCRSLLQNLGLDRVLTLEDTAAPVPDLQEAATTEPQADRDEILEAHRNLVAANPQNAVRFKDVIEFLEQSRDENQP